MAECCCSVPSTADASRPKVCGGCRTAGKPVDSPTVKALLTETALSRFDPAEYRFCPDAHCDVVYFAEGVRAFRTADVRIPVWQKESAGHRTICYCFAENEGNIAEEVNQTGHSLAVDRVREHIAAGRCACEVRNPKGACCLGDVIAAVERMRKRGVPRP